MRQLGTAAGLIIGIIVLLGGGCVRSIQPILKDDQVVTDDSLAGRWVTKDGKETVDVEPAGKEDKTSKVTYTDKDGKRGQFSIRLGKFDKLTLIEIHPEQPAPEASDVYKAHLLPLYSFLVVQESSAKKLALLAMSDDWLKKYLKDHPGELKVASVEKDNFILSSDTAEIQTFIVKHNGDEGVWGEPGIFVRPGDATTQAAP